MPNTQLHIPNTRPQSVSAADVAAFAGAAAVAVAVAATTERKKVIHSFIHSATTWHSCLWLFFAAAFWPL